MAMYDRQIATAARLIKKYAQLPNGAPNATWIKHNATADVSKPWRSSDPGSPTSYPVYIVFTIPPGGQLAALVHLMQGTEVPMGAPAGIMAAVPFTPEENDVVDRAGDKLVIKTINEVAPNGRVILYKLVFS